MQNKLLINGELVSGDGESLPIVDPATGAEITQIAEASPEQVDAATHAASEAFETVSYTHLTLPTKA